MVRMRHPSKSDVGVDSISLKMDKRKQSEAWSQGAFDYHTPEKGGQDLPPQAAGPEAVPSWHDFTQETTIHGVKYVFHSHSTVRRVLWVVICLGAVGYFTQQVTTSILRYYAYNTVTDIQVNYVSSVAFPAVTICNQNNFRTSATAKFGLYDFIDDIYSAKEDFKPAEHNWQDVGTTTFINVTAHQLEDFIDSCSWRGKSCSSTDFERIFTGIGVCYTFNGKAPVKYSREPGTRTGLSLVLNVEQYEYMRGPNNDAGVKVLLHDPDNSPEMTDQGFVVAPGTHTLVNIHQEQVTSLPHPFGTCIKDAPPYHTCMANCRNTKAANLCGCRDIYMANVTEAPQTLCDMNQTFVCLREAFDVIQEQENDCNCSITCSRTLFEPSLSYAELSGFNIDQVALTDDTKKEAVRVKFEAALETQQRVVETIKNSDDEMMTKFITLATDLYSALNETYTLCSDTSAFSTKYKIPNILDDDDDSSKTDFETAAKHAGDLDDTEDGVKIAFWDTRFQLQKVRKSLLNYDAGDWALQTIQQCIDAGMTGNEQFAQVCGPLRLPTSPSISCDEKTMVYCFVPNLIALPTASAGGVYDEGNEQRARNTITTELSKHEKYSEAVEFAFAGQTLDPTKFSDHYACDAELNKYENQVLVDFLSLMDTIKTLETVADLTEAKNKFIAIDQAVNVKLAPYLLVNDSVEIWRLPPIPSDESEEEIYDAKELNCSWYLDLLSKDIDDLEDDLMSTASSMKTEHNEVTHEFEDVVKELSKLISHYNDDLSEPVAAVKSYLEGDITKKNLSGVFTDHNLIRSMSEISTMKTELTSLLTDFEDVYKSMTKLMESKYEKIFEKTFPFVFDSDKEEYPFLQLMLKWYNDEGGKALMDAYLQLGGDISRRSFRIQPTSNITEQNIWITIQDSIHGFRHDGMTEEKGLRAFTDDVKHEITSQITKLTNQFDVLSDAMQTYGAGIQMDTTFYKTNFLQLDIFYKELSYEVINQEEAFKFESLLGEVGGFLGLLLGASILTVCELIDYLVIKCTNRCSRRRRTDVSEFGSETQLNPKGQESNVTPTPYYRATVTPHK